MLQKSVIDKILDVILKSGAVYAEIYSEDTWKDQISMAQGQVTKMRSGVDAGVGIRICDANGWRYLCSSDSREEALLGLVKENLLSAGEIRTSVRGIQRRFTPQRASIQKELKLLEACDRAGRAGASRIRDMRVKYLDTDQYVQIANSEGLYQEDERRKVRLYVEAIAERDGEVASSHIGPGRRGGPEFFQEIDLMGQVKKTAAAAEHLLGAVPCPGGVMPVIIASGFGGLLFHEACGHSLEASSVRDGGSEFSGRVGERVASDKVTLIDDGALPGGYGSSDVDDEGIPTRKNVLIQHGILKTYLSDRADGEKIGLPQNGSSRRESYRYAPISRMSNTYIEPGETSLKEMISSIQKGLYVKSLHAGSVNSMTGEFNFHTKEAYFIEHGEITAPVKSVTLAGVGGEVLQKIEMVGSDFKMGQGFCFAGSGTLSISVGQPSIKVSDMLIGGEQIR